MMGVNQVEAIPYKDFKDKVKKVSEELTKNRHVVILDDLKFIYSARKWENEQRAV